MAELSTLSLAKVIKEIPRRAFEKPVHKSMAYVVHDALLFVLCWLVIAYNPFWLIDLAFAVLMGYVLTGIFVLGHDCGHRSFSNSVKLNNAMGEVLTGICLWPFQVWRISHDYHHMNTHHVKKEIAWKPLTVDDYLSLKPIEKFFYRHTRKTLFFLGSWLFTLFHIKYAILGDKYIFKPETRPLVMKSIKITGAITAAYLIAAYLTAGLYGILMLFVIPQFVFQFWLSFFTYFHHTHPEIEVMSDEEWNPVKAQLESTVHMRFHPVVDWLTHDISWHVPHHVCSGIPHYNLRIAHKALKEAFPDQVREETISLDLVKRSINKCHLIGHEEAGGQSWVRFDEIMEFKTRSKVPAQA